MRNESEETHVLLGSWDPTQRPIWMKEVLPHVGGTRFFRADKPVSVRAPVNFIGLSYTLQRRTLWDSWFWEWLAPLTRRGVVRLLFVACGLSHAPTCHLLNFTFSGVFRLVFDVPLAHQMSPGLVFRVTRNRKFVCFPRVGGSLCRSLLYLVLLLNGALSEEFKWFYGWYIYAIIPVLHPLLKYEILKTLSGD